MKPVSKFFTPALSPSERRKVSHLLGLSALRTLFVEKAGDDLVLSRSLHTPDVYPVALRAADLETFLFDHGFDLAVVLSHRDSRLGILPGSPLEEPTTLWEAILPFPLDRLAGGVRLPAGVTLRTYPLAAETDLARLFETVTALERQVYPFEAVLFWLESGGEHFPLLFHYVRKRLIRFGTSARLQELGHRFEAGQLTQKQLDEALGTRSIFLPLIYERQPEESLLQALESTFTRAGLSAVTAPHSLWGGTSPGPDTPRLLS